MPGRLARAARFTAPSLAAAVIAAAVAGVVEAAPETETVAAALAATGFLAMLLVPLGCALSLLARGLVRAWRPAELAARLVDDHGGAPRLAAWMVYLFGAALGLAALVLNGMRAVLQHSTAQVVHLLAAPILAVAAAVVLAAVSMPTVNALAVPLTRLDRRVAARRGRALLRPRVVLAAALVVSLVSVGLAWQLSIAPRIGPFDLGFVRPLAVWAALVALLPLLAAPLARRRRGVIVATVIASLSGLVPVGEALWLHHRAPGEMLELWGTTRLAGFAIDTLYDVETLRDEIKLEHIAPTPRPGAAHPDVVLITIDTVRADLTPPYGGDTPMPSLAGLAREATTFEWAFSPGNVTRRSLPSIATGLSPPRVRGRVAGWALKLDPRHVLLAERFAAAGYDTAGFFCCDSHFGARHKLGLTRGISHVEIEYDGGALAERAAAYLATRPADAPPLFLWMHFIEPHNWEKDQPPKPDSKTRRARYQRSLTEVDGYLGTALSALYSPDRRARTVLVVAADHGESLGEHGSRTHALTLYNSEVHVPLLIAAPGVSLRRVARPIGLVDLAPTLLDLAGFDPPGMPQMDGTSLAPILRGEVSRALDDGHAYIAMLKDRSVAESRRAVVVGHYKLIVTGDGDHRELYDIIADRDEKHDIAAQQPAIVEQLERELAARRDLDWVASGPP